MDLCFATGKNFDFRRKHGQVGIIKYASAAFKKDEAISMQAAATTLAH